MMPELSAAANDSIKTTKAVKLTYGKDGTRVVLIESPINGSDVSYGEAHPYDLGVFNQLTAESIQSRLTFRFAVPGSPLNARSVEEIKEEIHRYPFGISVSEK